MCDSWFENICPYSTYSLMLYIFPSMVDLGKSIQLPPTLNFIFALFTPLLLLHYGIKKGSEKNYVTLVKHSSNDTDHEHSTKTTIGVILISSILSLLLNVGLTFLGNQLSLPFKPIGAYLVLLSFFHLSEYFVTSLTNPRTLNLDSFLIFQSTAYVFAITSSLVEYVIESFFFPNLKQFNLIAVIGLIVAVCGETIRKVAIFTAGKNFSHTITYKKSPEHQLITHGIYSIFRHPSYAGWFYWALGCQILLQNPICFVVFTVISNNFFKNRIKYEEEILVKFFSSDYEKYRREVRTWMPLW